MGWGSDWGNVRRPLLLSLRLSSLLALSWLIFGCANTVDIDARDRVNFSNFEVAIPVNKSGSLNLRLRGSTATGEFSQSIGEDDRVDLNDDVIRGPTELDGELDLEYYSLALGGGYQPSNSRELQSYYYIGLGRTNFELELEDEDSRVRKREGSTELYVQYGLDYAATDSLSFGLSWALSVDFELSGISEIDLKAEYQLLRQLELSLGYRWFDYTFEEDRFDSRVQVDFHGPLAGIKLMF